MRDVFDGYRVIDEITELAKSDRLYLIVKEFAAVDLHPSVISGHDMGYIFEELISKFADSNSTQAGDHFTPREVIALMVDILFHTQDDVLDQTRHRAHHLRPRRRNRRHVLDRLRPPRRDEPQSPSGALRPGHQPAAPTRCASPT